MDSGTKATIRSIVLTLKDDDSWDSTKQDLKNSVQIQLQSTETPEAAFALKLQLDAMDRFFSILEDISSATKEGL